MIAAIQSKKSVSEEEYLRIDRQENREKNGKYEYFNQKLIYMAGGSLTHGGLIMSLGLCFGNSLRKLKNPILVFTDTKVKSHLDYKNYFYPDVIISDGRPRYEDEVKDILINPLVIVEVLSDSTEGFDRGDKFKSYRNIESLKEYLLVSQGKKCVEQFYRDENGRWQFGEIVTTGILKLKSIDIEIAIDDVYFNIESESSQEE
jgi:Uma2 family endonuclease